MYNYLLNMSFKRVKVICATHVIALNRTGNHNCQPHHLIYKGSAQTRFSLVLYIINHYPTLLNANMEMLHNYVDLHIRNIICIAF